MRKQLSYQENLLKEIINDLTKEITAIRPDVLKCASNILNRDIDVYSINGIIGGKNNIYVDSVRTQFLDFEDFFVQWLKGLNDAFEEERTIHLKYNNDKMDWDSRGSFRNIRLLKDEKIRLYARKFLERNFYKNLDQRIRIKPDENLWSLWFGYQLTYGLLIAPVKRNNEWTNDKSEIRRVSYNYWTVGHVMNTGLIDSNLDVPMKFNQIDDFYVFYQSVLKGLSKSKYEKDIYDKYIDYLKSSSDLMNEPFLIPEFRYAGLIRDHEYRLDFTLFNQHTLEFLGFEISPASSHMSVKNLKQKQFEVNEDLKEKWEKEMSKRNDYFKTFGITIITFTDSDLKDINKCFDIIREKLNERPKSKPLLANQIDRLKNF